MTSKHFIDFDDISSYEWERLYAAASDIIDNPSSYTECCKGKILATLFYEPSTRTQFSFQSAMLRLGGNYIGFSDPRNASVAKGESLRDTIKIVSNYADAIVIRSPHDGAARAASLYSRVPVINAGDGSHLHPTQTMADLTTIARLKGGFSSHSIGVCGDLLNGRTVHSLLKAMSRYSGNTYYLISTPELALPDYVRNMLLHSENEVVFCSTIEEVIGRLDVLYMTRIQKERFPSGAEYLRQSGVYCLTPAKMALARPDLAILHPLPKVDEINPEVDDDPRARYFEQAEYGMYIRMALLMELCKNGKHSPTAYPPAVAGYCHNPKCITNVENYLPQIIKDCENDRLCGYCEHAI